MFDKWKNVKIAGTVVILAAIVIFLFMNVRIKSASDYRAEKVTGIHAENASENAAESEAVIVGEGGQNGSDVGENATGDKSENVNQEGENGNQHVPETEKGTWGTELETGTQNTGASQEETQHSEEQTEAKNTIQVSIEIRCDSAVKIKDSIKNPGIKEKIPDSGEILRETVYSVPEGTNVYELLSMAAAANGIAITAYPDKSYVTSINNLNEKMLSQQSGWKYSVNDWVAPKAASSYILQNGDRVKWFYVLSANEE